MPPDDTPRLSFAEMTVDDLDDMAALLGDPEVMRYYPRPRIRDEALDWIEWNRRLYREKGFGLWVVRLRATGEFLGDCGLTPQEVDGVTEIEVGYHVRAARQGQGYATEAAAACRDYARRVLGRDRLIAIVDPANRPAQRVAEKIGLRYERDADHRSGRQRVRIYAGTAGAWVLHVDLDQFFASVEVLRRPELRGRPVVVGGSGDPAQPRTVVATASREARAFGVRSGMPMRLAARRCPDAVFLPTDMPAYQRASARVMAVLRAFPVRLEVCGLDEAFVGGVLDDPQRMAAELRSAILERTGLTCAIGIGRNKNQAKIAARFAKRDPAGIATVTDESWLPLMGERPVGELWGVGPRTVRKLDDLSLRTVADLAAAGLDRLRERFPVRAARWLTVIARGGGDTEIVTEPWVARSRSREVTFPHDLTDRADIEIRLTTLARELTAEVAAAGRQVIRVGVKVRSSSFFTQTREAKLRGGPTTDPDVIAAAALAVLAKFDLARPVRLLGVRADLHVA